ncbi:MAG: hypothetical protein Q7W45_02405 [Bacteroidota bacterium]|nr:hypothetical protein [Bacteroidota bacterium]MDP3145896.1 hypothetical protein [Bacteroidota bacterium]MDP3558530.1 hypothetical protein [Bacteroidota bacterium]
MKNKIILPLIAIIFLSSCATKFNLTKRKYTKGYYFASSKNSSSHRKENEQKNYVVKKLPIKNTPVLIENSKNPEVITTITSNEPIKIVKAPIKTNEPKNNSVNYTASTDTKNNFETKANIKPVSSKQDNIVKAKKKGGSDTDLIILVILSIFPILALIAMYLHDGKSITLNFWIDLLLHFIFLYWLFALLVVFDIIDLR